MVGVFKIIKVFDFNYEIIMIYQQVRKRFGVEEWLRSPMEPSNTFLLLYVYEYYMRTDDNDELALISILTTSVYNFYFDQLSLTEVYLY